ncbi:MAG: EamA family transporter [Legionella sp.]|nr:EamA family transporter [Legionella sp.]
MPISHLLLALAVVVVWGMNFLFVSVGLTEIPPFLLCGLRFALASIPAILFIKRPQSAFHWVVVYGLVMFGLQFAFLFLGMSLGMPPGIASVLIQTQVFFSMFFAVIFLREQPKWGQIIGALVSFSGIALVARHTDQDISLIGFFSILAAAATWGLGNLITKKLKGDRKSMLGLISWGSFAAAIPMLLLSFVVEGQHQWIETAHRISWKGIGALCYIVYASTWVGYGLWNWLLARYPVGMVAPFTLLVPVVAMVGSVIFLGEAFYLWKLVAGLLVMSGLCINVLGSRLAGIRARRAFS